jgi:hypothetical protein
MRAGIGSRWWMSCGWMISTGLICFGLVVTPLPAIAYSQTGVNEVHLGTLSEPPSPAPAPSPATNPFTAGSWLLSGYGSAAVGRTSHQVYAGHLGLGYYLIDHLALNVEGVGYFVDHAHKTGGGGINLLPRWHYLVRDLWSLYLDGGVGFIYTRDTLRDPGTHFNFTVQAGLGASYRATDRLHPMIGYRWFHISNARIRGKDRNVGFDSPMFYVGVMSPF